MLRGALLFQVFVRNFGPACEAESAVNGEPGLGERRAEAEMILGRLGMETGRSFLANLYKESHFRASLHRGVLFCCSLHSGESKVWKLTPGVCVPAPP